MKFILGLVLAIILPILLILALAYAQNKDSQPETVSLDEILKSLD